MSDTFDEIFLTNEKPVVREFSFGRHTLVEINLLSHEDRTKIDRVSADMARGVSLTVEQCRDALLGRRAVKGWRHRTDPGHPGLVFDGQPLPFNDQNVFRLMIGSPSFVDFVKAHCYAEDKFAGWSLLGPEPTELEKKD